jgi:hypothetical protein
VRPDVLVYFTDGHGPAPKERPVVAVIWCLTPAGRRPAPWGWLLRMGGPTPCAGSAQAPRCRRRRRRHAGPGGGP